MPRIGCTWSSRSGANQPNGPTEAATTTNFACTEAGSNALSNTPRTGGSPIRTRGPVYRGLPAPRKRKTCGAIRRCLSSAYVRTPLKGPQQEAWAKAAQERERSARAAADKRAAEETAKAERALAEAALERERAARATAEKAEALAEVAQQRARAAHADADAAAAREQAALAAAAMADLRLAQVAADASETQRRAAEAAARTAKRIARLTTLGLAAASMLALLAGGAGLHATLARQDADAQRHRAEQRLKLATTWLKAWYHSLRRI